jgi:hypothetical protein
MSLENQSSTGPRAVRPRVCAGFAHMPWNDTHFVWQRCGRRRWDRKWRHRHAVRHLHHHRHRHVELGSRRVSDQCNGTDVVHDQTAIRCSRANITADARLKSQLLCRSAGRFVAPQHYVGHLAISMLHVPLGLPKRRDLCVHRSSPRSIPSSRI